MGTYYTKQGKKYTVEQCSVEDIEVHFDKVADLIGNIDIDIYKNRMVVSVGEGYAYKVTTDKLVGFMYVKTIKSFSEGVSIWGEDPIGFMLLLKDMFEVVPGHKVIVHPHNGNAAYMKSITTGSSLRNFYNHDMPIAVHIATTVKKFEGIYTKLGITSG